MSDELFVFLLTLLLGSLALALKAAWSGLLWLWKWLAGKYTAVMEAIAESQKDIQENRKDIKVLHDCIDRLETDLHDGRKLIIERLDRIEANSNAKT